MQSLEYVVCHVVAKPPNSILCRDLATLPTPLVMMSAIARPFLMNSALARPLVMISAIARAPF
jgi:hypothetical protein